MPWARGNYLFAMGCATTSDALVKAYNKFGKMPSVQTNKACADEYYSKVDGIKSARPPALARPHLPPPARPPCPTPRAPSPAPRAGLVTMRPREVHP